MLILENEILKVEVSPRGAELQTVLNKVFGMEYLWDGNPTFWSKRSPVLFPIVGTLKSNTYIYGGKRYELPRHGFARDMEFENEKQFPADLTLLLKSSPETRKNYPFDFEFRIRYQLIADELSTEYLVTNTGSDILLFSVGGHPAFRLPLVPGTHYEDYYLKFDEIENLPRWPISKDGLLLTDPVPVLEETDRMTLRKTLFYQDALVFKYPSSSEISLLSAKTPHGIRFLLGEFPFLGIWSAKDADFICIEPWCGVADSVTSNQFLENKEGIEKLSPGKTFSRQWRIKVF
jgi:galactose mutarotase-like enzyme